MRKLRRFRPSPALVLAAIALFAAIGGVAVALPGHNSVKSDDIKNNNVKSVDLQNNNVKGADVRESSLGKVPSAKHANTADRATDVFAANVDSSGNLLGSIPGGVTSIRVSEGTYRVDFPHAVAGCLIFSAFGSNNVDINPGSTGVIPATNENPNRVAVATFNNAGAVADRDFYVQMTCP
jgi:hypothetical protein